LDLIRDRWLDLRPDVRDAVLRLVGANVPQDTLRAALALLDGCANAGA
jgi:hypothetical protein